MADDLATAPGSACFTAIDATALATWSGVLADYPNIWTAGTGCGTASGAEAWFTATVPPSWTFSVTETGTSIAMDVANGP